jgi:drug/metabolite transporter (DMT)-like permease
MQAFAFTLLAMLAFAGNSLLCRLALRTSAIDPASFTTIRLASGALALWLIVRLRGGSAQGSGNWLSAFALFAYAAAFSFAYLSLTAATGALLLFGAVQLTMFGWGLRKGDRPNLWQAAGVLAAFAGLVGLLLPGLSAPPLVGATLMIAAGVAWGAYSLRGRGAGDPTRVTAGNFARAVPFAAALSLAWLPAASIDARGAAFAVASGALASGVGYALWYSALKHLHAPTAATIQLSVPAIAAAGGVILLGEELTLRLVVASAVILGGIAVAILGASRRRN